jgi:hypothetical protein
LFFERTFGCAGFGNHCGIRTKLKAMNIIRLFFFMIIIMPAGRNLMAQAKEAEAAELSSQIFRAREASNELLLKYSWTSRTEVLKSKEVLNIMIEKNQFDAAGKPVQKLINQQGAKMPKVFLIREIAETEKENMEKFLFGMRDFLKKYTLQGTDQVKRFIDMAAWQVVDSTHEFIFTGKNVEEAGDQLTWMVEDIHYTTARIEVTTRFEDDLVYFTGTFLRLKDGLNYMAYAEAVIPSKNITLQLQNYDYIRE